MEQRSAANLDRSNRDVGGPSRVVGGSDRSGVAGTAAGAAGAAAGAAGNAAWAAGTEANRDRTDSAMEQRSAVNLDRGVPAAAVDCLESGFRVFDQHLAADWVDQQPVGGQEV